MKMNNSTEFSVKKLCYGSAPLDFLNDEELLCYQFGYLGIFRFQSNKMERLCRIPDSRIRKMFIRIPILARRYGLNEIKAAKIDENSYLINYHLKFYVLDVKKRSLEMVAQENLGGANGSVLYMTTTSRGVMFGDYGYNPQKKEKGIYLYTAGDCQFTRVYSFKDGEINHIHNIIEDPVTNRLWIFVGDFDNSAAIYFTDDFFETMHCIGKGSQQYRGCVACSSNNTLYYATDSPLETNHLIKWENGVFETLFELNGSCIYSSLLPGKILFSTTVENQTDELNNTKNMYKYNLGAGIKNWNVEVLIFDVNEEKAEVILRSKKDILPMMPYKYGCFRFPATHQGTGRFICRGQAVKKYENWMIEVMSRREKA